MPCQASFDDIEAPFAIFFIFNPPAADMPFARLIRPPSFEAASGFVFHGFSSSAAHTFADACQRCLR